MIGMLQRLRVMLKYVQTAQIAWDPPNNMASFPVCQTSAAQGDEEDARGDHLFGDFVR